jgi:hypothetical protein
MTKALFVWASQLAFPAEKAEAQTSRVLEKLLLK